MVQLRAVLSVVFAVLMLAPPLAAQDEEQGPRETALSRARVAVALRDSLLRLKPDDFEEGLGEAGVEEAGRDALARFLRDPFATEVETPPTLHQLDVALAQVNARLRTQRSPEERQKAGGVAGASSGVGRLGGGVLGGLGLPSEAQLLVGLTDFMVERAKDDVAFGFVLTLRNNVREDTWIRVGLPRSYLLMQRMDDRTYSTFLPVLRSAFVEDLNTLPARAFVVADSLMPGRDTSIYLRGLAIAYQRGLEIRQGSPPAVALANLAGLTSTQMPDRTTRRALHVLGLVAREYAAGGGEAFVREISRDDRGWMRRYLVGFLARDLLALDPAGGDMSDRVLGFMAQRESDVLLLINQFEAMRGMLQDVQRTAQAAAADVTQALREGEAAGAEARNDLDRALAAAGAVLQVLNTGQRFLYWGPGDAPPSVGVFREFVGDANTLHQAFIKHDYASLVTWALRRPELSLCAAEVRSLVQIRADAWTEAERQVRVERRLAAGAPLTRGDSARVRARAERGATAAQAAPGQRCGLRAQYLSFAASLASARSADDVTVALREASAPVGSYRAKRNQYTPTGAGDRASRRGPWSASLGGYLGATTGLEEGAYHFGAALPVGMEVSYGMPLGAVSLFIPVLDLGTLASARLGDDDDEPRGEAGAQQEPDQEDTDLDETGPTFRQVLAPGAFVVWNLSRSLPVSVGAGWQVVPELRERGGDRVTVSRWSVFVAADVTLFNFRF